MTPVGFCRTLGTGPRPLASAWNGHGHYLRKRDGKYPNSHQRQSGAIFQNFLILKPTYQGTGTGRARLLLPLLAKGSSAPELFSGWPGNSAAPLAPAGQSTRDGRRTPSAAPQRRSRHAVWRRRLEEGGSKTSRPGVHFTSPRPALPGQRGNAVLINVPVPNAINLRHKLLAFRELRAKLPLAKTRPPVKMGLLKTPFQQEAMDGSYYPPDPAAIQDRCQHRVVRRDGSERLSMPGLCLAGTRSRPGDHRASISLTDSRWQHRLHSPGTFGWPDLYSSGLL